MKPTNLNKESCSPISSNCVIWQGPDIACINLCKGDSVSEVVSKLATELCNLLDLVDVEAYELACLNLTDCGPKDFKQLIQLLIDRICQLEGVDPSTPTAGSEGCPDCTVSIAECFYFQNPQGDTVTTMQLIDYVTAIGNSVCTLVGQISTINSILQDHEDRITTLETNDSSDVILPRVTPVCVGTPGQPTDMNIVLGALEQQFCELVGATGSTLSIYSSIANQCAGLNNATQLSGNAAMSSLPGWHTTVGNLAQAITNIWLTICDMRSAIQNIQQNCCTSDCDGVDVSISGVLNATTLTLFFNGSVPTGYAECSPTGTLFTITDSSGGSVSQNIQVLSNLNNTTGVDVDLSGTPVNTNLDLTITATFCVETAEGTQCQSIIDYTLGNTALCPTITATSTDSTVGYSFSWSGGAASFDVELYNSSETTLISSQTTGVGSSSSTVSGTFTGLNPGTQYKLRVLININGTITTCPFTPITTVALPCTPPGGVTAALEIL